MAKIVAVLNQRGEVGKTTMAIDVAVYLLKASGSPLTKDFAIT